MAYRDYLAEEVAEDWVDGLITRREAIWRLALLGLSLSAAASLLAACAAAVSPAPGSPAVTTPTVTASRAPASAPAASVPAGTVAAGRPVVGKAITFPGRRGTLQGFFSPAATPAGAMLVIHENRGLTDHIRSVATRLAGDGYSALAIDLLSEEGGTGALTDPAMAPSIGGASRAAS